VVKGNIIEEDASRKIYLPFGEEYSIRLTNKKGIVSACDLSVDGEKVSRFILRGDETVEIERYLDGNLSSGKKFKFVSINSSQVKDKNNFENGIVEASFFEETLKPIPIVIHKYPKDPYIPYVPIGIPLSWRYPEGEFYYGTTSTFEGFDGRNKEIQFCNSNFSGATVRGSESNQKFKEVSGYEFSSTPTILKLKIVNGELKIISRYCNSCGRKRRDGERYCSNCGGKYVTS
jgi:hypothetical protein